MHTYNIYFSIQPDVDASHFITLTHALTTKLLEEKLIQSSTLNKLNNKANFAEIPDFHLAIHFADQKSMESAFEVIKNRFTKADPHKSLMQSVSEFKVTFTESI